MLKFDTPSTFRLICSWTCKQVLDYCRFTVVGAKKINLAYRADVEVLSWGSYNPSDCFEGVD